MDRIATMQELGARLAETRKLVGMSQADLAAQVGLDRTAITKIEAGTRNIDSLELSRIARALRRPVDWFLSLPPQQVVSRRQALDVSGDRPHDVELELLARDVEQLVELRMLKLPKLARPAGNVETVADAERAASWARSRLGVSEAPLGSLLTAADELGVVCASLDLNDDKVDGSYVALETGGVALINGGMPSGRRRFTLAHEIGHHVLADAYSAEWVVPKDEGGRERLVNAFAIHFLMPRDWTCRRWNELDGKGDPRRAAIFLGAEGGVSWSALCAQLRNLRLVSGEAHEDLLRWKPTGADYLEFELSVRDDLRPPVLSPHLSSAVVKAYRTNKLGRDRALELLRGTLTPDQLPEPASVPLDAMRDELAPLPAE